MTTSSKQQAVCRKGMIFLIPLFLLTTYYLLPTTSYAQDSGKYTLLEPLPLGPGGDTIPEADLSTYLSELFRLFIMLAGALAVFRLIQAGVIYMSTDAFTKKNEAKGIIQDTLLGLGLVLGSWIIVATIMPESVEDGAFVINLNIPAIITKKDENLPVPGGTGGGGLQPNTVKAVSTLRQECNCTVRITSTTGDSHTTNSLHYRGLAVDIGPDTGLTKYITGKTTNPQACATYSKTLDGVNASFKWEPKGQKCGGTVASTGDHWHMSVTQ